MVYERHNRHQCDLALRASCPESKKPEELELDNCDPPAGIIVQLGPGRYRAAWIDWHGDAYLDAKPGRRIAAQIYLCDGPEGGLEEVDQWLTKRMEEVARRRSAK